MTTKESVAPGRATVQSDAKQDYDNTSIKNFKNDNLKERILEKTTTERLIERPFSTQPKYYVKRGCNTVRSRSIFYVDQLRAMGYSFQLPLEQAKELFSQIVGIFDRTSLKAYFGTLPGQSTRKIRRWARYQSGTQSIKDIELTQDIKKKKGYLEKLNLVSYEKKGNTWFMVLENLVLIPQLMKANSSNDKISLIPIHNGLSEHRLEASLRDAPEGTLEESSKVAHDVSKFDVEAIETTQTNNNLQSEREISQVKVKHNEYASEHITPLTPTEKFLLAKLKIEGGS